LRNVRTQEALPMRWTAMLLCAALPAGLGVAPDPPGGGLKTPTEWKWRLDSPAPMAPGGKVDPGQWWFVAMPPGWHVTMGPGGLLYHPGYTASGRFVVESELFLFPTSSDAGVGIFVGGRSLGEQDTPEYTALLFRKDASATVVRSTSGTSRSLVPWTPVSGVAAHAGKDAEKHAFRIDADTSSVTFSIDGNKVAALPRTDVAPEGSFGFRVDRAMNIHIVRLDFTQQLAPPRPVKSGS
jgi:hypothetical protein